MPVTIPKLPKDAQVEVNFSAMEYDWVQKSISLECHCSSGFFGASFTYDGTNQCTAEYILYNANTDVSMKKIVQTYKFSVDTFDKYFIRFLESQLANLKSNRHKCPDNYEEIAIELFNEVLDKGTFVREDIVTEYAE